MLDVHRDEGVLDELIDIEATDGKGLGGTWVPMGREQWRHKP